MYTNLEVIGFALKGDVSLFSVYAGRVYIVKWYQ